jgi:hypothetical protein
VKELSMDWKGKVMFPCHVIHDFANMTAFNFITDDPPPMVNSVQFKEVVFFSNESPTTENKD